MKTIAHILSALVLVVTVANTPAHTMNNDSMMMNPTHHFMYISPGFSWIGFGDLNNYLALQNYSRFPAQAWTLAVGNYKDWDRFIMEHHIMVRIWGDNPNGGLRTSLGMGEIFGDAGFNVLAPSMPVDLYPYLGFGAGINWMNFRSNTKTLPDAIDNTPPDNVMVMQATPLFDIGLGSNYLLASKDSTMGFAFGLRIGYLVDLYSGKKWNMGGTTVTDLPSIMQNGAYIRLVLGGWGKHHHHHMEEQGK
jgi:hypothetical protein